MQIVTVECQNCELAKSVEFDGVAIIGNTSDGKVHLENHELTYKGIVSYLADAVQDQGNLDELMAAMSAVLYECLSGNRITPDNQVNGN